MVPGDPDIAIFSPIRTPLILHNPVARSVADKQHGVVDGSEVWASEDPGAIGVPVVSRDCGLKWAVLQQGQDLGFRYSFVMVVLVGDLNLVCRATDARVGLVGFVRVSRFYWHSFE